MDCFSKTNEFKYSKTQAYYIYEKIILDGMGMYKCLLPSRSSLGKRFELLYLDAICDCHADTLSPGKLGQTSL